MAKAETPVVETTTPSQLAASVIPIPQTVDETLAYILQHCRAHGSKPELEFCVWLTEEIIRRCDKKPEEIELGCLTVSLPTPAGGASTTLFSSHVDTVHHYNSPETQSILYDPEFGHIFLDNKGTTNCLGADDGAGVWLMLEMLKAGVPGTYVFHRGEERGCLGANAILTGRRKWLAGFEAAVAFDRPRTDEVITHQGGVRCCSDKYAQALCDQLNDAYWIKYSPSDRGVYTDTRVYRTVIPECTNIGVGYENQHSKDELLDYAHLVLLRDAVLKVNWEALPIDRDPLAAPPPSKYNGGYNGGRYSGYYGETDWWEGGGHWGTDDKWRSGTQKPAAKKSKPAAAKKKATVDPALDVIDEVSQFSYVELVELLNNDGKLAASLVLELAGEVTGLREKLKFLKESLR